MCASRGIIRRCPWCGDDPLYVAYHDREWGFPVGDDTRLFEKLCLEGFQAGLAWITILRKRDAFRAAFHGFAIDRVAAMRARDVERLLADPAIVRHRGKIEAAINNAKRAREVVAEHGSLAAYLWRHEPRVPANAASPPVARTVCAESVALARDLKRRGFRFVGPTTVYAFMQAMGLVNDHLPTCDTRALVQAARARFAVPR
ncbi:MAG: DNA-3-methyladenine glycosylase I [Burkholderiales bacterium]|nr:DNA-3-methyladenine glycosylase I [Burkholderiales bacterium]